MNNKDYSSKCPHNRLIMINKIWDLDHIFIDDNPLKGKFTLLTLEGKNRPLQGPGRERKILAKNKKNHKIVLWSG